MEMKKLRCKGCGETEITGSYMRKIEFATLHEIHAPTENEVLEEIER